MLRIATVVLGLFSGTALAAAREGSVTSPEAGVLCDKKAGFCADSEGIAVGLTKMYLGDTAEKRLMDQIREAGQESFDPTSFVLTNGVACNTKAKKCTVTRSSDKVDAAHTKTLFGGSTSAPAPGAAPAARAPAGGFDQTLDLQGVTFRVRCPNVGSVNRVHIEPNGLKGDNSMIAREIDGAVTATEVADLERRRFAGDLRVCDVGGQRLPWVAGRVRRQQGPLPERGLPAAARGRCRGFAGLHGAR